MTVTVDQESIFCPGRGPVGVVFADCDFSHVALLMSKFRDRDRDNVTLVVTAWNCQDIGRDNVTVTVTRVHDAFRLLRRSHEKRVVSQFINKISNGEELDPCM